MALPDESFARGGEKSLTGEAKSGRQPYRHSSLSKLRPRIFDKLDSGDWNIRNRAPRDDFLLELEDPDTDKTFATSEALDLDDDEITHLNWYKFHQRISLRYNAGSLPHSGPLARRGIMLLAQDSFADRQFKGISLELLSEMDSSTELLYIQHQEWIEMPDGSVFGL